jgi:hypothetical protein
VILELAKLASVTGSVITNSTTYTKALSVSSTLVASSGHQFNLESTVSLLLVFGMLPEKSTKINSCPLFSRISSESFTYLTWRNKSHLRTSKSGKVWSLITQTSTDWLRWWLETKLTWSASEKCQWVMHKRSKDNLKFLCILKLPPFKI